MHIMWGLQLQLFINLLKMSAQIGVMAPVSALVELCSENRSRSCDKVTHLLFTTHRVQILASFCVILPNSRVELHGVCVRGMCYVLVLESTAAGIKGGKKMEEKYSFIAVSHSPLSLFQAPNLSLSLFISLFLFSLCVFKVNAPSQFARVCACRHATERTIALVF